MTDNDTDTSGDVLRQWLLQQLPAAQAESLEERLMRDDALLDRLREAEIDLVDDYARGALDPAQAEAFRTHRLAGAAQRDGLRAARAWARLRERSVPVGNATPALRGRHATRWLAIAAGVVLAVAMALVWNARSPTSPPTYTLLASTQRGTDADTLRLAAFDGAIRLQLEVADPDGRYQLLVLTQDVRRPVAHGLVPRPVGAYAVVEANVGAALLPPGRHRVLLVDERDGGDPVPETQAWEVDVGAAPP